MRTFLSIFLAFFVHLSIVKAGEQCSEPTFVKSSIDKMADDWFGLKCDPLDDKTWPSSNWKSPCDCIQKGEKFTRIKEFFFKKNRQKREDLMKQLLEKKVAEVLRSQIDSGFEQSLRLDTLLKQGVFKIEENSDLRGAYPKSCRVSKIKDAISNLQELKTANKCDQNVLNKRLKILLNGKSNFDDYYKEKNDTYGYASLNMLSPQDKKKGMCIPYKSFQSLNNQNPYKKTYLSVAKLKSFKDFQNWATNRANPDDVFDLVAKDTERKRLLEQAKASGATGIKGLSNSFSHNRTMPGLERFVQENDSTNGLEGIDREAILHLIKTDPIFERMVKDEKFFNEVTQNDLLKERKHKDKDVLKAIMKSQDSQCEELFGASNLDEGSVNISSSDERGGRGGRGAKAKSAPITSSTNKKSLLEQYLCEEDFPAKFANQDSIRNVLAPEFKEVGEIKGIKHTEWILAKWAYCRQDQVSESDDNGIVGVLENGSVSKVSGEKELSKLLDLSLNPKSDLESTKGINNQYQNFNKAICDFVPEKCKDSDAKEVDFECSTAHVAENVITNMLGKTYKSKDELADVTSKINDLKYSDKELREFLKKNNKLSEAQIDSLIIIRKQTVEGRYRAAKEDLKTALGLTDSEDIDQYLAKNGGVDKVMDQHSDQISGDLRRRLRDVHMGYIRDNIYGEIIEDDQGSYFSNYYALGTKDDVKEFIGGTRSSIGGGTDVQTTGPGSSGTVDQTTSTGNGDVIVAGNGGNTSSNSGGYKRKAFWPTPGTGTEPKIDPKPGPGPGTGRKFEPDPVDPGPKVTDAEKPTPVTKAVMDTVADVAGGSTGGAQKTEKSSDFYLSSSSDSGSGSKGSAKKESGGFTKTEDASTKELEDRLEFLKNKIKEKEDSSLAGGNGSSNAEIQKLRDEVATEESRLANRKRMQSVADASSRYSGGGSPAWGGANGFSGNNGSSAVRNNGNYANAYDPLDRASTGRRDLKEPSNKVTANNQAVAEEGDEAAGGGAGGASGKASKKGGAGGSSLTASAEGAEGEGGGVSPNGAIKKVKGSRFPASENGESDPDDLCGYEQELSCYFEYASIDVLSPSVSRFVEYLELQGRSFKAVEVFKYKNNAKPTRYFIHYYEPMENMTKEDKDALYAKSKELLKDYKKNKKELKTIASQVVEVKKTEVTKDEVKELSKSILRVPDLNKLSERRARNQ